MVWKQEKATSFHTELPSASVYAAGGACFRKPALQKLSVDICRGAAGVPRAQAGSLRLWLEWEPMGGGADVPPTLDLLAPLSLLVRASEGACCVLHGMGGSQLPWLVWPLGQPGLLGQLVPWWLRLKNAPAMQETQVPSLGQEDPLEKGMAAHSGILAWRILCIGEPAGLQSVGSQRVRHD